MERLSLELHELGHFLLKQGEIEHTLKAYV